MPLRDHRVNSRSHLGDVAVSDIAAVRPSVPRRTVNTSALEDGRQLQPMCKHSRLQLDYFRAYDLFHAALMAKPAGRVNDDFCFVYALDAASDMLSM